MIKIYKAGPSKDLEALVYAQIENKLKNGSSVLMIVPAQHTLRAEEEAFKRMNAKGFFNLHIMSANKLQQEIMHRTGGSGRRAVNTLGRGMLLRRLSKALAPEYKAFGRVASRQQFLKMGGDFIVQMKQNNLSPAETARLAESLEPGLLRDKLSDMSLLADAYCRAMAGRFTDSEDRLAFVTGEVPDCSWLKDFEIVYYGFYSFTPREVGFMTALARQARALDVFLRIGEDDGRGVYAAPLRAVSRISRAAEEQGISCEIAVCDDCPERSFAPVRRIMRCATAYHQAKAVAAEILRLVREENYNYSDISILTGDMASQGAVLRRELEAVGIPVFADEKRSIMHHPAAIAVSALLDMAADGFMPSNIISFAKNSPLPGRDTDVFENYISGYHVKGKAFMTSFKYGADKLGADGLAELEAMRSELASVLVPYTEAMADASSASERTAELRHFLADVLDFPDYLNAQAALLAEEGFSDASEESAQIWELISGMLDQVDELMGDEPMDADEFRLMLEAAFEDVKVGLLPQAGGKVLLGSVGRSIVSGTKALFVIGFNEGIIPASGGGAAIFTDRETEILEDKGCVLSKNRRVLEQEALYSIYDNIEAPSGLLWLCYPLADTEGRGIKPSNLLRDIEEAWGIAEEDAVLGSRELLQGEGSAVAALTDAFRCYKTGESAEPDAEYLEAYRQLKAAGSRKLAVMERGLSHKDKADPLRAESVAAVYGDKITLSPSSLENYANCPFRFFVGSGLRPAEPLRFDIGSREAGSVYHRAIELFCNWMTALDHSPSDSEIDTKIAQIYEDIKAQDLDGLLSSDKENAYKSERLQAVASSFAKHLRNQISAGRVDRMFLEEKFGPGKRFSEITVDSPAGSLVIRGTIDRADFTAVPDGEIIKVVDYKSGERKLGRELVEEAVGVQLMIYLESALKTYPDARPAGVFYCHISSPSAEAASLSDLELDSISGEMAKAAEKKLVMNGLFVNSPEVIESLDRESVNSGESDIYKKNQGMSPEDFEAMRLKFRQSLTEICARLLSGSIEIRPHKLSKPCEYCDYGAICVFKKRG